MCHHEFILVVVIITSSAHFSRICYTHPFVRTSILYYYSSTTSTMNKEARYSRRPNPKIVPPCHVRSTQKMKPLPNKITTKISYMPQILLSRAYSQYVCYVTSYTSKEERELVSLPECKHSSHPSLFLLLLPQGLLIPPSYYPRLGPCGVCIPGC